MDALFGFFFAINPFESSRKVAGFALEQAQEPPAPGTCEGDFRKKNHVEWEFVALHAEGFWKCPQDRSLALDFPARRRECPCLGQ